VEPARRATPTFRRARTMKETTVPVVDRKEASSSRPRRAAALLVASAAMLFTAACSGSDSGGAQAGATPGAAGGQAFAAYQNCLKENGVTLPTARPSGGPGGFGGSRGPRPSGAPDRSGGPRVRPSGFPGGGFPGGGFGRPAGVDDATWEKAQTACQSLRPTGRPGGAGRGDGGRGDGASAAYRTCLQDHGVTMGGQLKTADPAVAKALETCKVLRPTATPSP
jgi:hypothetical protein